MSKPPADAAPFTDRAADWLGERYDAFKSFIEASLDIHNDAIHVLAGFAIMIGVSALLRRSLADWRAFIVVTLLAVANELYDLNVERWPDMGMQMGESAKDIVLTVAIPAVLVCAGLITGQPSKRGGSEPGLPNRSDDTM